MEGFILALALVDAIPVLCFGASMILVAARFDRPLCLLPVRCFWRSCLPDNE